MHLFLADTTIFRVNVASKYFYGIPSNILIFIRVECCHNGYFPRGFSPVERKSNNITVNATKNSKYQKSGYSRCTVSQGIIVQQSSIAYSCSYKVISVEMLEQKLFLLIFS